METLARASSYIDSLSTNGPLNHTKHLHFFADNTGACQHIFKGTLRKAQHCSLRFRGDLLNALDATLTFTLPLNGSVAIRRLKGMRLRTASPSGVVASNPRTLLGNPSHSLAHHGPNPFVKPGFPNGNNSPAIPAPNLRRPTISRRSYPLPNA